MMLGPVLNLVNGPIVGDAIRDPNNRHRQAGARREGRRARSSRRLYLAFLSRLPTAKETGRPALKAIAGRARPTTTRMAAEATQAEERSADYEKTSSTRSQAAWEAGLAQRAELGGRLELVERRRPRRRRR